MSGSNKSGIGLQAISRRRMPRDLDAKLAQLLNQSPYLGAAGADLFGDLGAADHDRGMVHQQAHDASQAGIGLLGVSSANCDGCLAANSVIWRRLALMREL